MLLFMRRNTVEMRRRDWGRGRGRGMNGNKADGATQFPRPGQAEAGQATQDGLEVMRVSTTT